MNLETTENNKQINKSMSLNRYMTNKRSGMYVLDNDLGTNPDLFDTS